MKMRSVCKNLEQLNFTDKKLTMQMQQDSKELSPRSLDIMLLKRQVNSQSV